MGFQFIVLRGKKSDIPVQKLNMSVEKDNMTDKKVIMADWTVTLREPPGRLG